MPWKKVPTAGDFFFHDIPCASPPMPLMKGVGLTALKGTVGELKGTGHKGWTGSY